LLSGGEGERLQQKGREGEEETGEEGKNKKKGEEE
jgi:hypothetical protein